MANDYKLPREKIAELRESQRQLYDIIPLMDKMEDCGADCAEYRELTREALEKIEKVLTHFS